MLGQTCYIEDYVDLDPGDGHTDYRCGIKSRDGHKGTDIGLLSEQQMTQGVNVIAAASGRVRAVRDGLPDRPVNPAKPRQHRWTGMWQRGCSATSWWMGNPVLPPQK